MPDKKHLEELVRFIRDNRSDESHFEMLFEKLIAEQKLVQESYETGNSFAANLQQTIEKHAALYRENKKKGISTWSEFENFVTHFEKAVTEALHHQ